jgi:hypothetical protein
MTFIDDLAILKDKTENRFEVDPDTERDDRKSFITYLHG